MANSMYGIVCKNLEFHRPNPAIMHSSVPPKSIPTFEALEIQHSTAGNPATIPAYVRLNPPSWIPARGHPALDFQHFQHWGA